VSITHATTKAMLTLVSSISIISPDCEVVRLVVYTCKVNENRTFSNDAETILPFTLFHFNITITKSMQAYYYWICKPKKLRSPGISCIHIPGAHLQQPASRSRGWGSIKEPGSSHRGMGLEQHWGAEVRLLRNETGGAEGPATVSSPACKWAGGWRWLWAGGHLWWFFKFQSRNYKWTIQPPAQAQILRQTLKPSWIADMKRHGFVLGSDFVTN
jgi:hypothetical protein